MLIRDKIGQKIQKTLKETSNATFEVVKLETDEDFFEAVINKLQDEIELLHITKSVDCLAEIVELVDWLKISLGTTRLDEIVENRKEKLGLYWDKFYIKDFDER